MSQGDSPEFAAVELQLVRKAIENGRITGCCEWDEDAARRFDQDPPLPGSTSKGLKDLLIQYVSGGGDIEQRREERPEWRDYEFWYRVVIPREVIEREGLSAAGLARGVFVELRLVDDDPDLPAVLIVNCHEAT